MKSPQSLTDKLPTALACTTAWLAPYGDLVQRLLTSARESSVAAALNAARARLDFTFVPQDTLPTTEAYEAFIARTRQIPTRDNLHDLFNGLMWLTYPLTKQRLNTLQAAEISKYGISSTRGVLRDALTLFDENALLLQAPPDLVAALERREWRTLFIEQRQQWVHTRAQVFGHALLEKLTSPRKPITAHTWLVSDLSDDVVAGSLTPERLHARTFLPLPVLGIPGWWPENENPQFYADETVFRPASRRSI